MSLTVFAIVLAAALLHATWNAIVKAAPEKLLTTVLVTSTASAISIAVLPFLDAPNPRSWSFAACSAVLQVTYFLLVARAYEIADLSQTYPLMRGTAPLIVALMTAATGKAPQYQARAWVWSDVAHASPPLDVSVARLTTCVKASSDESVASMQSTADCVLASPTGG